MEIGCVAQDVNGNWGVVRRKVEVGGVLTYPQKDGSVLVLIGCDETVKDEDIILKTVGVLQPAADRH